MTARESLLLTPTPATVPEVGVLLTVLQEARRRTLATVARIADLDAVKAGHHSAGTLLYHVALIELDWLYADVLEKSEDEFPAGARDWFPLDVRDDGGRLSVVTGEPLERHMARLKWVRDQLDGVFTPMSLDGFRRPRPLKDYDVTPEWVLMHLSLHEAQHRGQLALLV